MQARNHKMFEILVRYQRQDRIEDSTGELTGYTEPYEDERTVKIVAPSLEIAMATLGKDDKGIAHTVHDLDDIILQMGY